MDDRGVGVVQGTHVAAHPWSDFDGRYETANSVVLARARRPSRPAAATATVHTVRLLQPLGVATVLAIQAALLKAIALS
jgi:hypothetical protein